MKFSRVTTFLLWVILAISLFFIFSLLTNLNLNMDDSDMNKWIDSNLSWAIILLAICCLATLIFEFIHIISDKKIAINSLVVIGLLGSVLLISYILSDSDIPQFNGLDKFIANGTVTPAISLWIGTGLIASYILIAIAILGIIYSTIASFFN